MRRSKLELFVDIIRALAERALTIDEIAFECGTNCLTLSQKMDFLIKCDMVSIEMTHDKKAFYALTRRGAAILKTFRNASNLEKLQSDPQMNESVQFIAELEQRDKDKASGI